MTINYTELLPYIVTMVVPPVLSVIGGTIIYRWNKRDLEKYVSNLIEKNRKNDPTIEASPLEGIE